jgi:uncharacterized protein YcbX
VTAQLRVAQLDSYPIKGCAAVHLTSAQVTPAGIAHDRTFLIVNEDGVFRTQRRHPQLALITPDLSPDGARLSLRHRDLGTIVVDVDTTGPRRPVDLHGRPFSGIDQGTTTAEWLSEAVGERCRLVRVPPEHRRTTGGHTPGTSGYADSSAVHMLSLATLGLLNERLRQNGEPAVPIDRFRPNIVIEGGAAHVEDLVRRATIGDCELGYAKLALRCVVTTVDQESARKRGPEPLRTLAGYRRTQGGVALGAKFAVVRPGKLSVGDAVTVHEWGESEL